MQYFITIRCKRAGNDQLGLNIYMSMSFLNKCKTLIVTFCYFVAF
jgi:hypothetical protein